MNGNGQTWKWIAGLLAVLIISSLPGYVALFRTGEQVDEIQQTQQLALERLAVLEVKNEAIIDLLQEARVKLDQLQSQPKE